jgi:integrase
MARGTIVTRMSKDGTKRYKTIIRINGKQQWRTWDRKRDAENYLDDLSPEVRDHTYREIKKATFGEYVAIWKQVNLNDKMLKPSTIPSYASVIEHHLLPAFKGYPMQAITPDEISLFRTRLLKAGLSGKTVGNVLNLFGKILANAKKDHYLKFNPMPDVDKPTVNKEQKGRALKPDEIQTILREAAGTDHTAIATAIATGMRRGEQFGLDWENLDFENNVIRIRHALYWKLGKYHKHQEGVPNYMFVLPKSKKSIRDIDMSPELRKELLELYLKSGKKGLVFPSAAGTPINPDNFVKRNFAGVLKKAEEKRAGNNLPAIGKVRWHDLRHTFGSLKIDQGEDLLYVSRQMGHGSLQVTGDIYAHQIRARRPEAAAKTDAVIFGGGIIS